MSAARPSATRRDVLKLAAATALAGAALPLIGCKRGAAGKSVAGAPPTGEAAMTSRPLMTVRIIAAPAQSIGAVPHGTRMTFPITGGDFAGPRLRGKILPGGGDWAVLRADGVLELDLRITLETDDRALIHMTFDGLRHGPPAVIAALGRGEVVDPASYYFRTVPRFETAAPRYDFLNRIVAIGVGENSPSGPVHTIEEVL
jgi:hypothetical protein